MQHAELVARLRAGGSVFAEQEADLLAAHSPDPATLEQWTVWRVAGRPLETILGWVDFAGYRVGVAPDVFVPRQRTALLARAALAAATPGGTAVEVCCGAAPVGLVLQRAGHDVWACDLDPAAVDLAQHNLGRPDRVCCGDLLQALPHRLRGRLTVVAANAPYVPTAEVDLMPREAREHEPLLALDGGPDGVALHRRLAVQAAGWLAPGGRLLIETSSRQADLTVAALRAAGLAPSLLTDEELDATVAVGRLVTDDRVSPGRRRSA